MLSRFLSNMTLVVTGSALLALALVLAPGTIEWIALGGGAIVLAVTAIAFLSRDRGVVQRTLDAPIAALGAWTIVASRVLGGGAVRWTTVGEAITLGAFAVAGLIVHEAMSERAVRHMLSEPVETAELVLRRRRADAIESAR